jgi:hypothetical protein
VIVRRKPAKTAAPRCSGELQTEYRESPDCVMWPSGSERPSGQIFADDDEKCV